MRKKLNITTIVIFDYAGTGFSIGGLQRWCRDLAFLARDNGYQVDVYQKALKSFAKPISDGISVHGLACKQSFMGNWQFCRELLRHVDPREPIVFVSQELALSNRFQNAIAVNHGIWWDGDHPAWRKWLNRKLQYHLLERMRGIICVDTNYINWCHTELPKRQLWQEKLGYIPNYADLDMFKPVPNPAPSNGSLRLLFPRRIGDKGRGADFLLRAWEILEKRGCKASVMLVGSCADREQQANIFQSWAADRGMEDRLYMFDANMDDMASVYAQADVVVIPTVAHEGTSLSAIEGIVSGKPTVVTHIGGLGNIVINGLNGHICDLTPESLADAIIQAAEHRLLGNQEILMRCRESLGKPRWEHQVWNFLQQHLNM
jgi:glycosyltransferase involved in cell wall biosynthesis